MDSPTRLLRLSAPTLALAFALLSTSLASAQVTSPNGSYGILANLWQNSTANASTGFLAILHFDGAGNMAGTYTVVDEKYRVGTGTLTGTYSGNPDGSNTVNMTLDDGSTVTLVATLTDQGSGLQFLVTGGNAISQGEVITGTGRIISAPGTMPGGSYGYLINRWPDANREPAGTLGVWNLDGASHVSGSYTNVFGGATPKFSGTFTGTYSVNPDSTGSITLTSDQNSTITLAIVVTDGGGGILMLQTGQSNNGGVLNSLSSGTARMQ